MPTQSKTTGSFSPPEIRETSATKSCFVFRIEDRVVAAVGMGHFGLSFRRNGADDRCAEGGRPLTENEARSAGRGMHEDQVTRLDGIHLPDQHLSSHTLQHHRGCLIEGDRLRQSHQPIGLYEPHLGIAAGRTGIGYPIADFQTAHILGDRLYSPGAFEARDKGKRLRVVSGAVINVNVVEACRRLTQAHLTRPGLTDIDSCPVQNLGTARLPNLDRMRHTDFRKNMNSAIF